MTAWLTSTSKKPTKTSTKNNTTDNKKPTTTATHNSIIELANNPGKFLRDYFQRSRPQTYHFFSIFYNNQRLPHLLAILFFSMLTGWMPLAYTRLFKLHTNVIQDGVSYALFYQASFAVILWGVLRVIAENLTIVFRSNCAVEISNLCSNNLHKKFSYYYNHNNNKLTETTDKDNKKTKKNTVINTDSANNISSFYENYSKSIVIKSMKLVKMLSYICYLATDAGRQLLHPLLLPLPVFYVLSRAVILYLTPEHEKLNKEVSSANQAYQSTFAKWTKNWTNTGLNGRAALRNNNKSKLNILSNINTKKQQKQNVAKELLSMIEKNTKKIANILSFICLIGIYGLPKLQSQSATAGIIFGYSVLNQIQVNIMNAVTTVTDVLCGKTKKNQEIDTSYESIKDLQEGLNIELNQQSDLTKSQPIQQPTLTDSILLASGVSFITNLWALLCFSYFNNSIAEVLSIAISPALATANITIAASLITLGILTARYYKLSTTNLYNQLTINFVAHFITLPLIDILFTSLTSLQPLSIWIKAATHTLACIGVNFGISKMLHQQLLPPIRTHDCKYAQPKKQNTPNLAIENAGTLVITHKDPDQYVKFYSGQELIRKYKLQSFELTRGNIACISAANSTGKSSLLKGIVQHTESPTHAESGNTDEWINLAIKGKSQIFPNTHLVDIKLNKHNLMYWKQADDPTELTGEYNAPLLPIEKDNKELQLQPMQRLFIDQVITNNDNKNSITYESFTVDETNPNHQILKKMREFIDDVIAPTQPDITTILEITAECTADNMHDAYKKVEEYIENITAPDQPKSSIHMIRWYAYMAILGVPLTNLTNYNIPNQTESGGLFSKIWTALQITTLHLDWLQILLLDEPCQQMDHTATPLAKTLLKVVNTNQKKFVLVIDHSIRHENLKIYGNNNQDITECCKPLLPVLSRYFILNNDSAHSDSKVVHVEHQLDGVKRILNHLNTETDQEIITSELIALQDQHKATYTTSIDTIYKLTLDNDNTTVNVSMFSADHHNTFGSAHTRSQHSIDTADDQQGVAPGSPANRPSSNKNLRTQQRR